VKQNDFPPGINAGEQVILFDGICKLCNGWSRFIIRFDRQHKFKLCSVQSEQGQAILQWFGYPTDYFETMLLIDGDHALEKTDAFISIVRQLPYPWKLICCIKLFPRSWRDWVYDRIALNRYKIFGKYPMCVLPTPDTETRFVK